MPSTTQQHPRAPVAGCAHAETPPASTVQRAIAVTAPRVVSSDVMGTPFTRCGGTVDGSLQDARYPQREAWDARLDHAPTLCVHLVRPFHGTDGGREDGAAAVAMRLAGVEGWLLAHDPGSLDLFDVTVAVRDDPV